MKLTITIPTYNRPKEIKRLIESLLPQLQAGVSISVFDNCSKEPVSALLDDAILEKITINRNTTNVGADANIARALESVSEGWVWLLGDDDVIEDNAVQMILDKIHKHSDCCFMNFCNKIDCETKNFDELIHTLGIQGVFGKTFFMSACVFNMGKLNPYIFWYYNFLSSQVGQLCFIIKYVELNEGAKCLFLKDRNIKLNPEGGWSKAEFIMNLSILFDKFYYCKRQMKSNVFRAIADIYINHMLASKLSFRTRLHLIRVLVAKYGLFNLLRYNQITLWRNTLVKLLPRNAFLKVQRSMEKIYLKNK